VRSLAAAFFTHTATHIGSGEGYVADFEAGTIPSSYSLAEVEHRAIAQPTGKPHIQWATIETLARRAGPRSFLPCRDSLAILILCTTRSSADELRSIRLRLALPRRSSGNGPARKTSRSTPDLPRERQAARPSSRRNVADAFFDQRRQARHYLRQDCSDRRGLVRGTAPTAARSSRHDKSGDSPPSIKPREVGAPVAR